MARLLVTVCVKWAFFATFFSLLSFRLTLPVVQWYSNNPIAFPDHFFYHFGPQLCSIVAEIASFRTDLEYFMTVKIPSKIPAAVRLSQLLSRRR
jgi:hypothetical protein